MSLPKITKRGKRRKRAVDFGDNPNIRGPRDSSRVSKSEPWEVQHAKEKKTRKRQTVKQAASQSKKKPKSQLRAKDFGDDPKIRGGLDRAKVHSKEPWEQRHVKEKRKASKPAKKPTKKRIRVSKSRPKKSADREHAKTLPEAKRAAKRGVGILSSSYPNARAIIFQEGKNDYAVNYYKGKRG